MNAKIKTKIYQLNFLHENQLFYSATFECSGLIALNAFISETLSTKDSYPSCFADAIEYTEIE